MDPIFNIELGDCPICRGSGVMHDEQGWCLSVGCMDCGAETANAEYHTPEQRLEAARQVAARRREDLLSLIRAGGAPAKAAAE